MHPRYICNVKNVMLSIVCLAARNIGVPFSYSLNAYDMEGKQRPDYFALFCTDTTTPGEINAFYDEVARLSGIYETRSGKRIEVGG